MNTVEIRETTFRIYRALLLAACTLSCCAVEGTATQESKFAALGGTDIIVQGKEPPQSTNEIMAHARESAKRRTIVADRERAIRDNALRYGSQNGFRRRIWEIHRRLESRSGELSVVYDFNRVVRPSPRRTGYLIPPVVVRSKDAFKSDAEGQTVSAADDYFEIVRSAAFSPTPPNWRDYLLIVDEEARPTSLQSTQSSADEVKQENWVEEGWVAGVEQADSEFAIRLRRLKRDYFGMLEFRRLATLGMVKQTEIFAAEFGVTGENRQMRIGDRTVKIVRNAEFNLNSNDWEEIPE